MTEEGDEGTLAERVVDRSVEGESRVFLSEKANPVSLQRAVVSKETWCDGREKLSAEGNTKAMRCVNHN